MRDVVAQLDGLGHEVRLEVLERPEHFSGGHVEQVLSSLDHAFLGSGTALEVLDRAREGATQLDTVRTKSTNMQQSRTYLRVRGRMRAVPLAQWSED